MRCLGGCSAGDVTVNYFSFIKPVASNAAFFFVSLPTALHAKFCNSIEITFVNSRTCELLAGKGAYSSNFIAEVPQRCW